MNSLTLPMAFGMDTRKRVPVPLRPDLYASLEDDPREGLKIGPFCARLVERAYRYSFLTPENIAWLRDIRAHLPGLGLLEVANLALSWLRREVQAARIVLPFTAPIQENKTEKFASPVLRRGKGRPQVVAPASQGARGEG